MSVGGYDPDFSIIERGYDQPPDEPHPRHADEEDDSEDDSEKSADLQEES